MNTYYVGSIPISDELYHHGIIGQKWGVRRYQNEDGSLTAAGRKKYGYTDSGKETGANSGYKSKRSANKNEEDNVAYKYNKAGESGWKGLGRAIKAKSSGASSFVSRQSTKKALKVGVAVAGTALLVYGAYKLNKVINDKNYSYASDIATNKIKQIMADREEGWKLAKSPSAINYVSNRANKAVSDVYREKDRMINKTNIVDKAINAYKYTKNRR